MQSHYLFAAQFGRPGKGNDKGNVEGLVGYARRNFMVPVPRAASWEELNAHLRKECVQRRLYRRKNLEMAWETVKANRGSGGVDGQSLGGFAEQLDQQFGAAKRTLDGEDRSGSLGPLHLDSVQNGQKS